MNIYSSESSLFPKVMKIKLENDTKVKQNILQQIVLVIPKRLRYESGETSKNAAKSEVKTKITKKIIVQTFIFNLNLHTQKEQILNTYSRHDTQLQIHLWKLIPCLDKF